MEPQENDEILVAREEEDVNDHSAPVPPLAPVPPPEALPPAPPAAAEFENICVVVKKVAKYDKTKKEFPTSQDNYGAVWIQVSKSKIQGNDSIPSEECLQLYAAALRRLALEFQSDEETTSKFLPKIFRIDPSRCILFKMKGRVQASRYVGTKGHELASTGEELVEIRRNRREPLPPLQVVLSGVEFGPIFTDEDILKRVLAFTNIAEQKIRHDEKLAPWISSGTLDDVCCKMILQAATEKESTAYFWSQAQRDVHETVSPTVPSLDPKVTMSFIVNANNAKNTNTHIGKALLQGARSEAQQQNVATTMASVNSLSDAQQQLGVYLEHLDKINKFSDFFTGKKSVISNELILSQVMPLPVGVSVKDFAILRKTLTDELFPKGQKNMNKHMNHPFEFNETTATWYLKDKDDEWETQPVPVSYEEFIKRLQEDPPRPELIKQIFKVGKQDKAPRKNTVEDFKNEDELRTKDAQDLKIQNEKLNEELQKTKVEKLAAENELLKIQVELLQAKMTQQSSQHQRHKSSHHGHHSSRSSSHHGHGHHSSHTSSSSTRGHNDDDYKNRKRDRRDDYPGDSSNKRTNAR